MIVFVASANASYMTGASVPVDGGMLADSESLENDNLGTGTDLAAKFGRRKRMKIPESIRELIAKAPFAHMTTLNSTGGPQVTVVWVGIEGEDFVIGHLHLPTYQKVKNIRRDPRVALSMLSDAANTQGLREYLVVYGNA